MYVCEGGGGVNLESCFNLHKSHINYLLLINPNPTRLVEMFKSRKNFLTDYHNII